MLARQCWAASEVHGRRRFFFHLRQLSVTLVPLPAFARNLTFASTLAPHSLIVHMKLTTAIPLLIAGVAWGLIAVFATFVSYNLIKIAITSKDTDHVTIAGLPSNACTG